MSAGEFPSLVVFDVDGTLQDTLAWWPALCNAARADFARQHGFALEPLTDDECNAVVGSAADLWPRLLPAERRELVPAFADFVIEREVELLRGRETLFDGTVAMLEALRRDGSTLALASNCGQRYLEAFLEGQKLERLVDFGRCLDGVWRPGGGFVVDPVPDKIRMLELVLAEGPTAGGAAMVGDRASDRDAARGAEVAFLLRTGWHERGALGEDCSASDSVEILAGLRALRRPDQPAAG